MKREKSFLKFVAANLAISTQKNYAQDVAHFKAWGGRIPCSSETLAAYLADCAASYRPSTISRRAAAIATEHARRGLKSPTSEALVRQTLRGIRRSLGTAIRRAKPLSVNQLTAIRRAIRVGFASETIKARDAAMLMLGFFGALRRNEIVSLRVEDVEWTPAGLLIHIRQSKTDQESVGQRIAIPKARQASHCPVIALKQWLHIAGLRSGYLFRRVSRSGSVLARSLSGASVSSRLKYWAIDAGLDTSSLSAHSLRAGFITAAAQANVQGWNIKKQSRHRSDAVLATYIRDAELWKNNAASLVMQFKPTHGH